MNFLNLRPLLIVAALTIASQVAHAQLDCSNPANIGSGDQGWGTTVGGGPNQAELDNACGTVGLGFYALFNDLTS